ncbi:hypothetical protein ACFQI3_07005 [Hansschlegelia quercus]|uniref:Uncharacterized protein n=1 Tax=Hansschlegelia quercus TaxID=2528245 RepID=A0A4Q9GKW7_9HYPH|nr:hypothetical protein [Hansschlegelia quercus]TBN53705.1 hypothetical protein EYR15_07835 [Hansschlegelia quercus]
MRLLAAVAALLCLAAPASAQDAQGATSVRGSCTKLVLAGEDAVGSCGGKLTRMTLPDGALFLIFTSGQTMIGFSGRVADEHAQGDETTWPVGFVNIGAPGAEPNAIPARGSCRSGDLNRASAAIVCSATTAQGAFEAAFRSGRSTNR